MYSSKASSTSGTWSPAPASNLHAVRAALKDFLALFKIVIAHLKMTGIAAYLVPETIVIPLVVNFILHRTPAFLLGH